MPINTNTDTTMDAFLSPPKVIRPMLLSECSLFLASSTNIIKLTISPYQIGSPIMVDAKSNTNVAIIIAINGNIAAP